MVFFITLLIAVGFFAFIVFLISRKPDASQEMLLELGDNTLRLTPREVTQINRLAALQWSAPELAVQLAAPLSGDAWQVAHMSLCSTLFQLGREDEAIQALERMEMPQKQSAVERMLQDLVDNGQTDKALKLLDHPSAKVSLSPLLRSALLLAQGNVEEMRPILEVITQDQALTDTQLLTLARMQQRCGMHAAAAESLGRVRALLEGEETSIYDWHSLLQVMADFQQYPALLELAELSEEHKHHIAGLIMNAGQYEPAMALLSDLDASRSYLLDYEEMLGKLLSNQQHEQAQRLLALTQGNTFALLLQQYVNWYISQGDTSKAQQLLDTHETRMEPITFHWLLLQLVEQHLESQQFWASNLQSQSERLLSKQAGQPDWSFMRLYGLRHQLMAQAKRSPSQRDSWVIRNVLEETTRLHADLPLDDKVTQVLQHCEVLHALGERDQAGQLLAQVREQLDTPEQADEEERPYHFKHMADILIKLGDLDQASELYERELAESWFKEDLLQAYIDAGRFEEALEQLDFRTVVAVNEASALPRLHKHIDALQEQDPPRHQQLLQRLLDLLGDDKTWVAPGQQAA